MMKKIFLIFLLVFVTGLLFGCDNTNEQEKEHNDPFVDIKDLQADFEFDFNSNLADKKEIYPLSNGNVYYVSEEGNDNNDGLSISTPFKTFFSNFNNRRWKCY